MKNLFLVVMAGFFFVMNTNAQVSGNANPNRKFRSDSSHHHRGQMMEQLNLTPDQKSQLKSLHESNKQQRDAIKNDASLTQDQKRAKMKDLQKSQSEKFNSILTTDQLAKRNAYIQKMKANRKMNGKQSGFGNHRKGNMMADLNLTPDQKSQMKAMYESNKQQRDAIKNDASLTQDQKRAKMKDLQKSQSDKFNSILTPDQQAKRNAYMEQRKSERKMQPEDSDRTNTSQAQ